MKRAEGGNTAMKSISPTRTPSKTKTSTTPAHVSADPPASTAAVTTASVPNSRIKKYEGECFRPELRVDALIIARAVAAVAAHVKRTTDWFAQVRTIGSVAADRWVYGASDLDVAVCYDSFAGVHWYSALHGLCLRLAAGVHRATVWKRTVGFSAVYFDMPVDVVVCRHRHDHATTFRNGEEDYAFAFDLAERYRAAFDRRPAQRTDILRLGRERPELPRVVIETAVFRRTSLQRVRERANADKCLPHPLDRRMIIHLG